MIVGRSSKHTSDHNVPHLAEFRLRKLHAAKRPVHHNASTKNLGSVNKCTGDTACLCCTNSAVFIFCSHFSFFRFPSCRNAKGRCVALPQSLQMVISERNVRRSDLIRGVAGKLPTTLDTVRGGVRLAKVVRGWACGGWGPSRSTK